MDDILDKRVLDELLSFADDGDPDLLTDLIQMFLDDGPAKVAAVHEGLAVGDFEKAERAAHSLKGSSGNLGAHLLQAVCEGLQLSTRNHEMATAKGLEPQLDQRYAEAEQALRGVLREYQHG